MEMDVDPSSGRPLPEGREKILRTFEAWLDRALSDEQPPKGLTAELLEALERGDPLPPIESGPSPSGGCDLYSVWAAMTALTQEVQLQGRTFKQLNETLTQSLEASAAAQNDDAEDTPAFLHATQQPRKQEIDVLLDLRDRVERGGNTARNAALELAPSRLPRMARWLGVGTGYARQTQEILGALAHGYSLTLASLDEALVACHVSRIESLNRIFDPQRMTAVDIEAVDSVPEGTVVEVYRNGYEWNGEVYRTAQVKVARASK
jgi:molecular chaperone GrpE